MLVPITQQMKDTMNRQYPELPLKRVALFFGLSCGGIRRNHDIPALTPRLPSPAPGEGMGVRAGGEGQHIGRIVMFQVALVVLVDDRVTDQQKINFSAYPQDGGDLLENPSKPGGRPPRAVLIEYIYLRWPLPNH